MRELSRTVLKILPLTFAAGSMSSKSETIKPGWSKQLAMPKKLLITSWEFRANVHKPSTGSFKFDISAACNTEPNVRVSVNRKCVFILLLIFFGLVIIER